MSHCGFCADGTRGPHCTRCGAEDDSIVLDPEGGPDLCASCASDRDERAMAAAVACPARCPPLLARRGEPCSLLAGHDGPHTIPIPSGDIGGVGSSWTNDELRVDGWLDDPDERENEDRSPTSPDRAVGLTLPDGPVAGRAALVYEYQSERSGHPRGQEDLSRAIRLRDIADEAGRLSVAAMTPDRARALLEGAESHLHGCEIMAVRRPASEGRLAFLAEVGGASGWCDLHPRRVEANTAGMIGRDTTDGADVCLACEVRRLEAERDALAARVDELGARLVDAIHAREQAESAIPAGVAVLERDALAAERDRLVASVAAYITRANEGEARANAAVDERAALAVTVERLRALAFPSWVQSCGDHSCLFEPPRGMATNGGCRCHEGRQAARLVRALAHIRQTLAATPAESLEEHDRAVRAAALREAAALVRDLEPTWDLSEAGAYERAAKALRARADAAERGEP